MNSNLIRLCLLMRKGMSPANSEKSDYINLDESPDKFNYTLMIIKKYIYRGFQYKMLKCVLKTESHFIFEKNEFK